MNYPYRLAILVNIERRQGIGEPYPIRGDAVAAAARAGQSVRDQQRYVMLEPFPSIREARAGRCVGQLALVKGSMVKLCVLQVIAWFEYHKRIRGEEVVVAKAL
ncbi:hypothetical protein BOH72_22050 [Mycobacterium sp. WY10]|nr:hypothetical protein BOH72_22050 [Mycobacterium sp. WY10]